MLSSLGTSKHASATKDRFCGDRNFAACSSSSKSSTRCRNGVLAAVCAHGFFMKLEPLQAGETHRKHQLVLYDLHITEKKVGPLLINKSCVICTLLYSHLHVRTKKCLFCPYFIYFTLEFLYRPLSFTLSILLVD